MKFLADEDIADVVGLFGKYGEVRTCAANQITNEKLENVDALLVRSVTRVDHQLLSGTGVSFVGSATSGIDHIDLDYLNSRDIDFSHAPGCNANAVVQYVVAVLCSTVPNWQNQSIGVIGCGKVGRLLCEHLQKLDVNFKAYDPFLGRSQLYLAEFNEVIDADIVSIHAPLTASGDHPTYHMFDRKVLASLKPGKVLINAGRGAVIDNQALLGELNSRTSLRVVLDVWEDEPTISTSLLNKITLGTPHIAGHSLEGKLKGSQMILEAFCDWQKLPKPIFSNFEKPSLLRLSDGKTLKNAVLEVYNPNRDHQALIHRLNSIGAAAGFGFANLRKQYALRREFGHFEIKGSADVLTLNDLATLGFIVNRSPGIESDLSFPDSL